MDIDIELPPGETLYQYDPVTIFFEREDGWQFLYWQWNDGTYLLADRPPGATTWSPPITGEKR